MEKTRRLRDYGIVIGKMRTGTKNTITDVPGVTVGHATIDKGSVKTGVTAVKPHGGNLFRDKVVAASHVINGFGKTAGLVQIEELGAIETPIILTNTLSVGTASSALVKYMLDLNADIGVSTGTINPVVAECNDGYLNDIRGQHVDAVHVYNALAACGDTFAEGAVGAGTGMSCYGLKGGIGSASRQVVFDHATHTVGVLVLANFGVKEDLMLNGTPIGHLLEEAPAGCEDKGSVIIIIATDIPMTERQLKRVARRSVIGLARTGSYVGNGSGDIAIAFTTANRVNHYESRDIIVHQAVNENRINDVFRAVVEGVEEAVLNALIAAKTTVGRDGNIRYGLTAYLDKLSNGTDLLKTE